MEDSSPPIMGSIRRSSTIEFVENRLPAYHPAFVNPPVHWDNMLSQYVPSSQALVPMSNGIVLTASSSSPSLPVGKQSAIIAPPPRPACTEIKAMFFWNRIFPSALAKFKINPEPKGRSQTTYSIRNKNDWDEIFNTLEMARAEYQKVAGPIGIFRKIRRKGADNIAPLATMAHTASDLAPDNPYSTPVLGAVRVILDAVKQAASVRKQALEGFDGLVPNFSDVELFLATFPGDENIKQISVELIVTTFTAIEQAIGFFISNELLRGVKATLLRDDYAKALLESLCAINSTSRRLIDESMKSHLYQFNWQSQYSRNKMAELAQGQQRAADGINSIQRLLEERLVRQDRRIQEEHRKLEEAQQMNMVLTIQNHFLRSSSPMLPNLYAPPLLQNQTTIIINQEALCRILNTPDLKYSHDIAFILDKKRELPERQRAQAEQIVNNSLFRDWIISPPSSKLLVQWNSRLPKTVAEVSPLSVFCANMVNAMAGKERFLAITWFCGQNVDFVQTAGRKMILSIIGQLLQTQDFDMRRLDPAIISSLQRGQIVGSENLLRWLVRQLPQTITLFCIIDGVVFYEREELCDEALPALAFLTGLISDTEAKVTVKVLFTSAPGPDILRMLFEGEEMILNVDTLPQLEWMSSDERLMRELSEGFN